LLRATVPEARRSIKRAVRELARAVSDRSSAAAAREAVARIARLSWPDAETLFAIHEHLLFLRAYPHDRRVLDSAQRLLESVPGRVAELTAAGADLSSLDTPETSGIAGTSVTAAFTRDLLRHLVDRIPGRLSIDWEDAMGDDRLGAALSRSIPLLEEEAAADANVPYEEWFRAARPARASDVAFLLHASAPGHLPPRLRAQNYDALQRPVTLSLVPPAPSRTLSRGPAGRPFFHDRPLLARRDVSIADTLASARLPVRRLPPREGERILELARGADAVRYRELFGFTYGDPSTVLVAEPGRGVRLYLNDVFPDRRLPLRAAYSAFVVKNGVPVAYVEALALFERVEVGFNVYYTFREGESAWIYAQVLRLFAQELGSRVFSVDPYQLGFENEEAVESGAFWFYRKLGFRPTDAAIARAVLRQEDRMAAHPKRRTSATMLRRFATSSVLYEAQRTRPSPGSRVPGPEGDWDRFHVRRIGLAVNRRMAREFGGDAEKMRRIVPARVARSLRLDRSRWRGAERIAFEPWALVLDLLDVSRWSATEKFAAVRAIRAKAGAIEALSLRLFQGHARLRRGVLRLGRLNLSRPSGS
jgi:hypothetical protein